MTQMANKCDEQDVIYIIIVSSQIYLLEITSVRWSVDHCSQKKHFFFHEELIPITASKWKSRQLDGISIIVYSVM